MVPLGIGEGLRSGSGLGERSSVGVSEVIGNREGVKLRVRLGEGVSEGVIVLVILGACVKLGSELGLTVKL
jgi:hypothetical protein